ncbi:BlaR1 family beta-lactam sensor/signal transducer [Lachnospiraceae bacterium 54-53]
MLFSLMTRLALNSIVISLLLAFILLVRKLFQRRLTARVRYQIWFLFLFVLAVPFLPCPALCFGHVSGLFGRIGGIFMPGNGESMEAASRTAAATDGLIRDFSVSVSRFAPPALPAALTGIWITGMAVMTGITLSSNRKVKQLQASALPLQNKRVREIFTACRKEAGIKKDIPVYSSAYLKSPIAAGFKNPCIIVPIHMLSGLPEKDIRFILLHELQHYRHKDLLVNRGMAIAQILYWFHPLVWFALNEMRCDREIACDSSVLSMLDKSSYLDYGNTLINFAEKISRFSYSAAGIGGSKAEIRKRILNIAGYRRESGWCRAGSRIIFCLLSALVLAFTPALSAGAYTGPEYDFSRKSVTVLDLESYFCGYEGSFVLYGLNSDRYCIYNQEGAAARVSPDSTYKIYSALAALENGVITPDSNSLPWDGTRNPFKAWNRDQTLKSAMEYSVNWYFTSLDKKTGLSSLKRHLDGIGYGNMDLSGGIGRYWLESSLKISPAEQADLLARFCRGSLPFRPENTKAVKDSLFLSSSGGNALYGKTGTGNVEGKNVNGWFIGFVETGEDTYVFAANIQGVDGANGSTAGKITMDILKDRNIYTP